MLNMKNEKICLIDDCTRVEKMRGLCSSCYQGARRVIKLGQTTWEELAERGMATVENNRSVFSVMFEKVNSKK